MTEVLVEKTPLIVGIVSSKEDASELLLRQVVDVVIEESLQRTDRTFEPVTYRFDVYSRDPDPIGVLLNSTVCTKVGTGRKNLYHRVTARAATVLAGYMPTDVIHVLGFHYTLEVLRYGIPRLEHVGSSGINFRKLARKSE